MIIIKRLAVACFGWLAFHTAYVALARLGALIVGSVPARSLLTDLPRWAQIVLGLFIAFLIGYLAYATSLIGVVIPLSRWGRLTAPGAKLRVFFDWLVFCGLWLLFSAPVFLLGPIVHYSGSAGSLEVPVGLLWSTAVAVWLYFQTALSFTATQVKDPLIQQDQSVAS